MLPYPTTVKNSVEIRMTPSPSTTSITTTHRNCRMSYSKGCRNQVASSCRYHITVYNDMSPSSCTKCFSWK